MRVFCLIAPLRTSIPFCMTHLIEQLRLVNTKAKTPHKKPIDKNKINLSYYLLDIKCFLLSWLLVVYLYQVVDYIIFFSFASKL